MGTKGLARGGVRPPFDPPEMRAHRRKSRALPGLCEPSPTHPHAQPPRFPALSADAYRTIRRASKGKVGHKELLETISEAAEAAAAVFGKPIRQMRKGKSLRQVDKVAMLAGGNRWYGCLSEYFSHGRADWKGASWRGGVASIDTVQDEFTFAGLMDYLVEQVSVMNAHASLCPVAGDDGHGWVEATLEQLREARETSMAVREAAAAALSNAGTAAED